MTRPNFTDVHYDVVLTLVVFAQRSRCAANNVMLSPTAVMISPTIPNVSMSFTALAISFVIRVVSASRSHSVKSHNFLFAHVITQVYDGGRDLYAGFVVGLRVW